MVFDSLFQKMSQNLPVYLQRYPPPSPKWNCQYGAQFETPLPPQNETANRVPNLKPPSLPKMKLPIGCPIWNPLKHEYYRFLSIHVYSNLPKIGRQCNPPRMKKLDTGQSGILFLADVPPPGVKKLDTGQSDILLLADVPPPQNWNWTKHEYYRKKIISREVIKYILPIYPPPSIIIIWFYAWTGNWWISISNGHMDSNPTHQPSPAKKIKCSFLDYIQLLMISQKNKMLVFGLHSTSGDWPG